MSADPDLIILVGINHRECRLWSGADSAEEHLKGSSIYSGMLSMAHGKQKINALFVKRTDGSLNRNKGNQQEKQNANAKRKREHSARLSN